MHVLFYRALILPAPSSTRNTLGRQWQYNYRILSHSSRAGQNPSGLSREEALLDQPQSHLMGLVRLIVMVSERQPNRLIRYISHNGQIAELFVVALNSPFTLLDHSLDGLGDSRLCLINVGELEKKMHTPKWLRLVQAKIGMGRIERSAQVTYCQLLKGTGPFNVLEGDVECTKLLLDLV